MLYPTTDRPSRLTGWLGIVERRGHIAGRREGARGRGGEGGEGGRVGSSLNTTRAIITAATAVVVIGALHAERSRALVLRSFLQRRRRRRQQFKDQGGARKGRETYI